MSELCQAYFWVLSGMESLNFFSLSYIMIHWFIYVESCCTAKVLEGIRGPCYNKQFFAKWPKNNLLAVSSQATAQFLGFANNASFVANNEYGFISPSLLCESLASSLHFGNFSDGWWDYNEFISIVNCQRKWTVILIYCWLDIVVKNTVKI